MKTRISHLNGTYQSDTAADLCEVFCEPEGETYRELFETGWLPTDNGEWYQSRSSRVKIQPISARRRYQIKKINVSTTGDYQKIFEESKYLYDEKAQQFLDTVLSYKHEIYYFNDNVFGVLNWFDEIPYFSLVLGGKLKRDGVTPLSCYYFIDKLVGNAYPYLYIGEWYDQFYYKSHYPNFEWWDGQKWNEGNF